MRRKLILSLITNRFGIVLVAINASFFASRIAEMRGFQPNVFEAVLICANLPILLASILVSNIVEMIATKGSYTTRCMIPAMFFSFLLVFQWLFVAQVARIGANYIKSKWLKI